MARALMQAAAALALWAAPGTVEGQERVPTGFERLGAFRSSMVRESSGVAMSRRHAGIIWTHNDSGDGPYIYAATFDGTIVGRHLVTGARAQDWEDVALAPCPDQPGDCLFIADTGDNSESRRSSSVYIVPEPDNVQTAGRSPRATSPARQLQFSYPDRPHDVEAMWIDPDGTVELVTKGLTGSILRFRLPHRTWERVPIVAEAAGMLAIAPQRALGRWITGGAISPGGARVALRTYTEVFFFAAGESGPLLQDGPPCWLGTREPQGEAVDFIDGQTLVLTSEAAFGQEGSIHTVRC